MGPRLGGALAIMITFAHRRLPTCHFEPPCPCRGPCHRCHRARPAAHTPSTRSARPTPPQARRSADSAMSVSMPVLLFPAGPGAVGAADTESHAVIEKGRITPMIGKYPPYFLGTSTRSGPVVISPGQPPHPRDLRGFGSRVAWQPGSLRLLGAAAAATIQGRDTGRAGDRSPRRRRCAARRHLGMPAHTLNRDIPGQPELVRRPGPRLRRPHAPAAARTSPAAARTSPAEDTSLASLRAAQPASEVPPGGQ